MSKYDDVGFKINEKRMYSETVYFDADGNEIARETFDDDTLWDDDGREPLNEWDVENYYG